jgi:PHD/YefM family antitoxin component YafN of YafNO toxin-antitoxin module
MTMKTISARQANQAFSELLFQVERGEEVIILKHGQPVAVSGVSNGTKCTRDDC